MVQASSLSRQGCGIASRVRQPHVPLNREGLRGVKRGRFSLNYDMGIEWCEVESPMGISPRGLRPARE